MTEPGTAPIDSAATPAAPIHIVHLLWHFSTGGLENGVVNLINHLPPAQFRHSIVSLTGHDQQFVRRIQTDNVSLYSLDKQAGHDWGTFSRLNRLLKTLQPDVLHSRNLATLELQLVGWWRKVPLRLHGEHGWDSNDIGGSNKKNRLLRHLFKGFVQRFICLSTESERYLTTIIGIDNSRVDRICNGVQTDKFSTASPATLAMPAAVTAAEPVIFATVGRLASVKNQALLLRSFALLLQQQPEQRQRCALVLVGDGGFLYTAQELATAVEELDSPLVVLLWNNDALGQIRDDMLSLDIEPIGVLPRNPDFAALARAFGCSVSQPASLDELQQELRSGFARNGVTLIELKHACAR